MTNGKEKTDEKRKMLDKLAEQFYPELSAPALVRAALEFEQSLK